MTSGHLFMLAAESADKKPTDHVIDNAVLVVDGWWVWTGHMGMLVVSGIVTALVMWYASTKIATGPDRDGNERFLTRNPFASLIEVICLYLREQVVRPILHDRTDRFIPFLWTIFFFILINNMLGLIPLLDIYHLFGSHTIYFGGTATANIWVTGALALIAFVVINIAGIRELGFGGYCHHLLGGAPAYMAPIMVPVEIMGTLVKPSALMIRLFANMNAGHILLATLMMFVGMAFKNLGVLGGTGIGVASMAFAFAIYLLEIFVGFLQAFIFMFLTTIFIGQLSHHGDEHHDEAHAAAAH
jgi:F-type H+-transporting ATPase subunit a